MRLSKIFYFLFIFIFIFHLCCCFTGHGSLPMTSGLHRVHFKLLCHILVSKIIKIHLEICLSAYNAIWFKCWHYYSQKNGTYNIYPCKKWLGGVILCSAVSEYCGWWKWRYEVCMISHAVRTEERCLFIPNILRHWLMQKCIEWDSCVCVCWFSSASKERVCMHTWEI